MNNLYIRDLMEPAFLSDVKSVPFSIVIGNVFHQISRDKLRLMKNFFASRQLGKYVTTKVRFNDITPITTPSYTQSYFKTFWSRQ